MNKEFATGAAGASPHSHHAQSLFSRIPMVRQSHPIICDPQSDVGAVGVEAHLHPLGAGMPCHVRQRLLSDAEKVDLRFLA